MIRSLPGEPADRSLDADILVIGAGVAGLLIATRLAERGKRVVVLESGGEHQAEETHPLNEVVHLRSVYDGAENGRFRCIGGTSTRWGGAMIPFLKADLEETGDRAWPLAHAELLAYRRDVERLFGLPDGPYEAPELAVAVDGRPPNYVARLASWPSFARRNVAALLDERIRSPSGPEIWLEATAATFGFAPDGRLETVTAQAPNGRKITVSARETVIAAGAIESTRLLLLADRQHGDRIFAPDDVLGRYFHDHLSVPVAEIEPNDRTALNRVAGFRFEGGGMRNLRFEPSEAAAVRAEIPAGFAHIKFATYAPTSFDAVRDMYRQLQQRRLPGPKTVAALVRSTPWLARAAWWRYRERRLLYPTEATIELHMVIEQAPRADNRILLSDDRRDAYGQPLAVIDWAVSPEDEARLTRSTDLFVDFWRGSTLAELGEIRRRSAGEAESELARGGGIYHPGGATRMGRAAPDGVLDSELRTFRVPNLSIASTSAFPSAGGGNPTMMLMMASLRLADRLAGLR
jgi:choline dehydrogenase-like flavoprotein